MTQKQETTHKLDYGRIIPIFVLTFVDVLGLTVILPLLHLYATSFGATPLEIGIVAGAFPLAQLIGVPIMGALSDKFGRKPLLLISQITTCLSFIMLGLANSLAIVILSRVIDGLFGANIATAQAALSDVTTEETRAAGLGLTGAAFGLGFVFGPLISILALELTDSLAVPALSAAVYSFISIMLTWFVFKETLPEEKRRDKLNLVTQLSPLSTFSYLVKPALFGLLVLIFAQQVIFFGFESLMGLFTLSRLGLLGQGNALFFLVIGITLVMVQVRFIGKWSQRFGERRLIQLSLFLLGAGLVLVAFTPEQPQPFYVEARVQFELAEQTPTSTEAILGDLGVELPAEGQNGIWGIVWMLFALIPLSIGAGMIRPSINSLLTKRVSAKEYGAILGVSSALVSAANAIAPITGGLLFQQYGTTTPFLLGGIVMLGLTGLSFIGLRNPQPTFEG